MASCERPRVERRARAADVEVARGTGGEARADHGEVRGRKADILLFHAKVSAKHFSNRERIARNEEGTRSRTVLVRRPRERGIAIRRRGVSRRQARRRGGEAGE